MKKNNIVNILGKIVANLKKHPVLLLTFGFSMVFLGIVTVVSEAYRIVSLSLIVVFFLGIILWGISEAIKKKRLFRTESVAKIKSGQIKIDDADLDNAEVNTGSADHKGEKQDITNAATGDVIISRAKIVSSKIKSGDTKVKHNRQ